MNNLILPRFIGLEIEFENKITNSFNKNLHYFSLVRDASVETPVSRLYKSQVKTNSNDLIRSLPNAIKGGEFVLTSPLSLSELLSKSVTNELKFILSELLLEENSNRSSIHIHIDLKSYAPNLSTFKNIVRMINRTEALIYKLSSFYSEHRGLSNNFNYYRPMTYKGAACYKVYDEDKPDGFYYGQLFDTMKLIKAKSLSEFFYLFGDMYNFRNWKYHPVRYHAVNLFSVFRHGSIEYRTMNLTKSYLNIMSMVLFFYYLTAIMANYSYNDIRKLKLNPVNSIYFPDNFYSKMALQIILDLIPDEFTIYKKRLIDIFDFSRYPKIDNTYYMSHMVDKSDKILFTGNSCFEKPVEIDLSLIRKPTYVDVHMF